jgi:hypothetical protein
MSEINICADTAFGMQGSIFLRKIDFLSLFFVLWYFSLLKFRLFEQVLSREYRRKSGYSMVEHERCTIQIL